MLFASCCFILRALLRIAPDGDLLRLLADYQTHYNSHRPHRGIGLQAPRPANVVDAVVPINEIRRSRVVGGLISEYHGRAA